MSSFSTHDTLALSPAPSGTLMAQPECAACPSPSHLLLLSLRLCFSQVNPTQCHRLPCRALTCTNCFSNRHSAVARCQGNAIGQGQELSVPHTSTQMPSQAPRAGSGQQQAAGQLSLLNATDTLGSSQSCLLLVTTTQRQLALEIMSKIRKKKRLEQFTEQRGCG